MEIEIKLLDSSARIPLCQVADSAGYDLHASIAENEDNIIISPGGRALIKTNIALSIPKGYYGKICPRSGLAVKQGIDVGAGIIDSGYHNEIRVLLFNFGQNNFIINDGDRIAQLIIMKHEVVDFTPVAEFSSSSERGLQGFGSTGK
jgi:dUTP pyrophosphatase